MPQAHSCLPEISAEVPKISHQSLCNHVSKSTPVPSLMICSQVERVSPQFPHPQSIITQLTHHTEFWLVLNQTHLAHLPASSFNFLASHLAREVLSKCLLSQLGLEHQFSDTQPSTFSNGMLPLTITSQGVHNPQNSQPSFNYLQIHHAIYQTNEMCSKREDTQRKGDEEQKACAANRINSQACARRSTGIIIPILQERNVQSRE